MSSKSTNLLRQQPDEWIEPTPDAAHLPVPDAQTSAEVQALTDAYRQHGYLQADINPLVHERIDAESVPSLDPRTYHLDDGARRHSVTLGGGRVALTTGDLVKRLRAAYCGPVAVNAAHLRSGPQRHWLQDRMEGRQALARTDAATSLAMFEKLVAAEAFENFLRTDHSRHKRFSLEGSESFIPLLETAIRQAAQHGTSDIVIGMPHRGRLNMLLNVMGVPLEQLMSLFTDEPHPDLVAWDIKDHLGYASERAGPHGPVRLQLAHNPSHLESVMPVVCGMARALQEKLPDPRARRRVMPLVVHGDASFCGQGIVMESLNISQTRGYHVGGTVHVIVNNQIGSTVSNAKDARSMLHCADIARAVDSPILHVNGDDLDAVMFAIRTAVDFRQAFGVDVVVDLIGYRRFGHNGHDDPTMTQPAMQRLIRKHPTAVELCGRRLVADQVLDEDRLARIRQSVADTLHAHGKIPPPAPSAGPRTPALAPARSRPVHTSVPMLRLREMVDRLSEVPSDFSLHPDIRTMLTAWRAAAADPAQAVDWCLAETLAYASLLTNGFNVRLTGLDVGRGSFFHRQAVWHSQAGGIDGENIHVPLRHLSPEQGVFAIFDTPLSEEAVLGFEYGYTLRCGRDLVVWEAQFGDFVNNAQVLIDQYIATGEVKWDHHSGLVMLLPHGHEGGGPEHTSGYLGRFLALCAEDNLRVAMPSTSAQFFHLLRRQAMSTERKPLVVMSPKGGLYADKASHSGWPDFERAAFQALLGEETVGNPSKVTSMVLTSGKLYHALCRVRQAHPDRAHVPIWRVEQLYPFPTEALAAQLALWPALKEVVWAEEEAKNHGAWYLVREAVEAALPPGVSLRYAGRPPASPCAVCRPRQHAAEEKALIAEALGL